jgi:hypothetical protein
MLRDIGTAAEEEARQRATPVAASGFYAQLPSPSMSNGSPMPPTSVTVRSDLTLTKYFHILGRCLFQVRIATNACTLLLFSHLLSLLFTSSYKCMLSFLLHSPFFVLFSHFFCSFVFLLVSH